MMFSCVVVSLLFSEIVVRDVVFAIQQDQMMKAVVKKVCFLLFSKFSKKNRKKCWKKKKNLGCLATIFFPQTWTKCVIYPFHRVFVLIIQHIKKWLLIGWVVYVWMCFFAQARYDFFLNFLFLTFEKPKPFIN